jgi:hypothetical protein
MRQYRLALKDWKDAGNRSLGVLMFGGAADERGRTLRGDTLLLLRREDPTVLTPTSALEVLRAPEEIPLAGFDLE